MIFFLKLLFAFCHVVRMHPNFFDRISDFHFFVALFKTFRMNQIDCSTVHVLPLSCQDQTCKGVLKNKVIILICKNLFFKG